MSFEKTRVIYAQIYAEGCSAELWLNGFPLSRITPKGMRGESIAAQQFLITGTNTLELVVAPQGRPSRARHERRKEVIPEAMVKGWVTRYEDDAEPVPEQGAILCQVAFETPNPKTDPHEWPAIVSQPFDMSGIARWSWQDAEPITLNESVVDEARAVLQELGYATAVGLVEPYFKLTEILIRDCLEAYPAVQEDLIRADLAQFLAHYQKVKDPVVPLRREANDFRLVAGGRAMQCIDSDGTASLKLRNPDDDKPVPSNVFLARIGGKLRIVR